MLSIPAFGWTARRQIKKMIIKVVQEVYDKEPITRIGRKYKAKGDTEKVSPFTKVRKKKMGGKEGKYLRYLFQSKWGGHLRVLSGMTYANEPLQIMSSFRGVIAIAFATGAYGLIFPSLWMLSDAFSVTRLSILSVFAVCIMTIWIIYAHGLWERSSEKNTKKMRRLYNSATVFTLLIAVATYYIALMLLFFVVILFVVPPELYQTQVGLSAAPDFMNYIKLGWVAASVATMAGAIGAGLEREERVRNITYGYRQNKRHKELEQAKKEEERKREVSENRDV